jgi:uncharacterized small protein (DUF1192 family)
MMCPMCGNEADDHTHELTSRFIAYMTEEISRLTAELAEVYAQREILSQ